MVQVYSDFVADLELPVVWLLCGWHGKECIKNRSRSREQSAERQARSCDVENVCDLGRECEAQVGSAMKQSLRGEIATAYQQNQGSLRAIAAHFGTSLGTVQRCVATIKTLDRR